MKVATWVHYVTGLNTLHIGLIDFAPGKPSGAILMAVATIEADEAVASSVFVQIMGTSLKKLLVRIIFRVFGHFASSDFKVWLRRWFLLDYSVETYSQ